MILNGAKEQGVTPLFFARHAGARAGVKIPLYHTLRGFVKHFLKKICTKKYPKISAKLRLVFFKKF